MAASPGAAERLAGLPNPFTRSVIPDAWSEAEGDVPDVNRDASDLCLRLIDLVANEQTSTGLLLTGNQGAGKTHLLARLRTLLEKDRRDVVFVYLRLESSASHLKRFLRRRFVDDLLRPWDGDRTRLETMLSRRAAGATDLETLLDSIGFGFNLSTVLRHCHEGRHRRLCGQWLRGDALPESALTLLGLGRGEEDEESQEDEALEMVVRLSQLASPHPVVLCCDQVESLEAYPGDHRGLYGYAQAASTLHDSLPNLLVVSCMQAVYYDSLREQLPAQIRERIWKHRTYIQPVDWPQARQLLLTRLARLEPLRETSEKGVLWPLADGDFRELFEFGTCPARQVVFRAEQLFEQARGTAREPAPEDTNLSAFLFSRFDRLREEGLAHPRERADIILAHGLPKLLSLVGIEEKPRPNADVGLVDLVCGDSNVKAAVSFCHQFRSALPRRLRKIAEADVVSHYDRVVLLRPASMPIGEKAHQTRQHLDRLRRSGAILVQPSTETMAALDALRKLLSDVQSGDLAFRGDTLAPETVAEWMATHLPESLERLVDDIAGTDQAQPGEQDMLAQNLVDYVTEHRVVGAAQVARDLNASEEEILTCARNHPAQIGILAGPPALLFEFVAEGFADDPG